MESRVVPYNVTGNAWPSAQVVTLSFIPDGTPLYGTITSNLFARMATTFATPALWQAEILKAAQQWAQQTNVNFTVVPDNGAPFASGNYQQGDPGFGDIRFGAYNFGNNAIAQAFLPPPINNYSLAGDVQFNSAYAFNNNVNGYWDLTTVTAHELGHSLGLGHSTVSLAEMYSVYTKAKKTLHADDISGIQVVYGGARAPDSYDAAASNSTSGTATNLNGLINTTTLTALVTGLDLTTTTDVDFYRFNAPTNTTGSLTVKVQSAGLSLMSPTLTVYAANGTTVLGSASGLGQYGTTLTVNLSGVAPGQLFYVKVTGAETPQPAPNANRIAFNVGKYALTLNFGTGANPTVPLPNTQLANGTPLQSGGAGWLNGDDDPGHDHDNRGAEVLHPSEEALAALHLEVSILATATPQVPRAAAPPAVATSRVVVVTPRAIPVPRRVLSELPRGRDEFRSGLPPEVIAAPREEPQPEALPAESTPAQWRDACTQWFTEETEAAPAADVHPDVVPSEPGSPAEPVTGAAALAVLLGVTWYRHPAHAPQPRRRRKAPSKAN